MGFLISGSYIVCFGVVCFLIRRYNTISFSGISLKFVKLNFMHVAMCNLVQSVKTILHLLIAIKDHLEIILER